MLSLDLNRDQEIEIMPPIKGAAPNVIPFGKYRGQPVEVLAADRGYTDWLMGQAWFRERYGNMYTLIVNNFQEPSETPEHNALQVLFLDKVFCANFIEFIYPGVVWSCVDNEKRILERNISDWTNSISFKQERLSKLLSQKTSDKYQHDSNYDDIQFYDSSGSDSINGLKRSIEILERKISREHKFFADVVVRFEENGCDVIMEVSITGAREILVRFNGSLEANWTPGREKEDFQIGVEIKPSVGDDYPAIIRQMKASRSSVIFTEQYTGRGATKEQFIQIFAASGIKVVFRHEMV